MATFLQQPLFLSRQTKNPYIGPYLKTLYNGHLFIMATSFCPQGTCCREVQVYVELTRPQGVPLHLADNILLNFRQLFHIILSHYVIIVNFSSAVMLLYLSRSSLFNIFPLAVLGICSMNSTPPRSFL